MKVPDFPEGVLDLDRGSPVPLSQQVYRGIRTAVRSGILKPGMRLPSSRALAGAHGISRNTVTAAYELLKAEAITDGRPGAAPVIAEGVEPGPRSPSAPVGETRWRLSARGALLAENLYGPAWAKRHGQLRAGCPAFDIFPFDLWARSMRRAARSVPGGELLYENPTGHPDLKAVLCEYLASERGVRSTPEQILITSSMQASLSGLAQALTDPGDAAWIEDPGYIGARTALHGAGLSVHGMPVDGEGATEPENAPAPKLIYLTPSHQYPLGMRMPLARRVALIETARRHGATILEDDYDSEFLFEGRPVAAMQGLAQSGEVIYLGTFSKTLLPGLRVSYCVVPESLADGLKAVFRQTGRLANVHTQIALADFINCGHYRAHLKRIREAYRERGRTLVAALRGRLGNRISIDMPTGNVQVALRFNHVADDEGIATRLQEAGFAVSPLSAYYLARPAQPGLTIGFASANEQQVASFAAVLDRVLQSGKTA